MSCLLLSLIFITSCNGQTGQQETVFKPKTPKAGYPRLVKTQGTGGGTGRALQDKTGNIWFCSGGEGVYRYDGKLFYNYTTEDGLNSNEVTSILEDKTGNIWFGTKAGPCRYDGNTFTAIPILSNDIDSDPNTSSKKPAAKNEVWSIVQDKTGKFWLGTTDGIYCYDGKSFTHFLHNGEVINNTGFEVKKVESILEDKAGNIWFGGRTTDGLFRFDGTSLTNFKPDNEVWLRPIFEDKTGNIWFGARSHSVYCYDGKTFTNFAPKEFTDWVVAMAEDKAGNLWFNNGHGSSPTCDVCGVIRYDGKTFTHFTTKDGLGSNEVWGILQDKTGNFWFGTGNGLCSYDGKSFTDFSDKASKDVRSIFEDKAGNLWLGTNGDGVCRYDPSAAPRGEKSTTYFGTKEGFSGTDVRCIAEDKNGNLWFGTNSGVSKFDGKNFTNFTVNDGLADNSVWSMLIDKAGTVWVGTLEGVCRYNPSTAPAGSKAFTGFSIPEAEQNDFSRKVSGTKIIWDIKEDRAGNIWFATNGRGAYRYNGKTLTNISAKEGLCSNFVNCIVEDKKGDIWFATQHGGVCRYHPSAKPGTGSQAFTTFTYQDGICSTEIWTMYGDKTGNVWIAGKGCGVDRYDGKIFTNFPMNTTIGLTIVRNAVLSVFEDRKGGVWVGCSGGLYRFDGKSFVNVTKEWSLGEM